MLDVQLKKQMLSIPVMFQKLENYSDEDNRFTRVKIWLMHLGENLNGSVFSKEAVDNALPTLGYIPIVGFISVNENGIQDFTDHRYILTRDKDGVCQKYAGQAYGVVLSSTDNNAHYEERVCDDGETRTFLVVEGVMWNMFDDSTEILSRDLIKGHSMELADGDLATYDGYEDENGLFHFTKFSFRAACILGDDCLPAMSNSTVEVSFTMTDFMRSLHSELTDKFMSFAKLANEKSNQGGIKTMPNTDYAQTLLEQFSDISAMVSQYETVTDRWGDSAPRFYLQDIQDNEIIVVDRKDNYRYYGCPFVLNGDKAEIDFTNMKRKKVCYADYVDGVDTPEGGFDFGKHIAEIVETAFSRVEDANQKVIAAENEKATIEANYTQVKSNYDDMKPKYDAYVQAEEQRKTDELNAQKQAKFAEYEDVLTESVEFSALKERANELTVDEIERECAVLYVKTTRGLSGTTKNTNYSMTLGVLEQSDDSNDYVVTSKYGNIPIGR